MNSRASSTRLVLPVVLAGTFMAILDVSIVVVAIPSIRSDLRAGYGAVEFVISAYSRHRRRRAAPTSDIDQRLDT